jgi:hypothetical protein
MGIVFGSWHLAVRPLPTSPLASCSPLGGVAGIANRLPTRTRYREGKCWISVSKRVRRKGEEADFDKITHG